jgi:hypothetical protein
MIENESDIYTAVHGRRLLEFVYRGYKRGVEPYAYGVDAGGQPILRAYQVLGKSDSGVPAWKLFRVEEMTELKLLDDTFEEPKPGYMRNDPSMTKIYCEL